MAIRDIEREMDRFFEKVNEQLHRVDQITGESFVRNARQIDTYKDDTANLRNSKGFVAKGPVRIVMAFPGGGEGEKEGRRYAERLEKKIAFSGLIALAGMSYAAAVEAKGYDVITMSWEKAKVDHKALKERVLKRILK